MKKIILNAVILISTFNSFGQGEQPLEKIEKVPNPDWNYAPKWNIIEDQKQFSFVKTNVAKLETCQDGLPNYLDSYRAANNIKLDSNTEERQRTMYELAKKYYLGATVLKTPEDTIGNYIRLIDIPATDKFTIIATAGINPQYYMTKSSRREQQSLFDRSKVKYYYVTDETIPYYFGNDEYYDNHAGKILIQNVNSKLYYVLNKKAIEFSYQQCENLRYDAEAQIYKIIPKVSSAEEVELLSRYKSLIKSANTNCIALQTIQRKYLTRGYFDANRVKGIDKQNYNKNLASLKVKADKLAEIDRHENKDYKVQDKLTMLEIASLSDINNWNMNFYTIN